MVEQVVEISCLGTKQLRVLNKDNVDMFHDIQSVIEHIDDKASKGKIQINSDLFVVLNGLADIQRKITKSI